MTFAGCAAFSSSNNNSSIKHCVLRKNAEVDAAGKDSGAKRRARPLFHNTAVHLTFPISMKITVQAEPLDVVIPAWSAGIQVDMDVSEGILAKLDAGNPCRHDDDLHFHLLSASVSS